MRRSHETWFHFTKSPRYFSAVDEVREPHKYPLTAEEMASRLGGKKNSVIHGGNRGAGRDNGRSINTDDDLLDCTGSNPLGKLPGSVWTVPSEPLIVPEHLGLPDHFAAFPQEWPRRIILGWSPSGICTACGEGRRPVVDKRGTATRSDDASSWNVGAAHLRTGHREFDRVREIGIEATIIGYACACTPYTGPWREYHLAGWTPPHTRPSVVLDPFGGTGTVAGVAHALGRHGISVDLSADYCRLAEWRISQSGHFQKAYERSAAEGAVVPLVAPKDTAEGRQSLFGDVA